MEGSTLQRIKEALLTRRRRIRFGMENAAEPGQDLAGAPQVEIIDIAQTLEQIDREKSLAEQERRDLFAIERALAKMATGTFGFCEDCGDEIPERRLLVLPEARLCAKCQAVEERQQGRGRVAAARSA
jgi:DnaK suppressor protein